jgi:hypothetical protein
MTQTIELKPQTHKRFNISNKLTLKSYEGEHALISYNKGFYYNEVILDHNQIVNLEECLELAENKPPETTIRRISNKIEFFTGTDPVDKDRFSQIIYSDNDMTIVIILSMEEVSELRKAIKEVL